MVGCTQYAWKFDSWELMVAQLASILIDPEKFYEDSFKHDPMSGDIFIFGSTCHKGQ